MHNNKTHCIKQEKLLKHAAHVKKRSACCTMPGLKKGRQFVFGVKRQNINILFDAILQAELIAAKLKNAVRMGEVFPPVCIVSRRFSQYRQAHGVKLRPIFFYLHLFPSVYTGAPL